MIVVDRPGRVAVREHELHATTRLASGVDLKAIRFREAPLRPHAPQRQRIRAGLRPPLVRIARAGRAAEGERIVRALHGHRDVDCEIHAARVGTTG